ncbi:NACHT domain-containing protein [Pectobacterium carotovorum subsp. carotovorum]|uniref:NACHT domain-containing protein n=1 Tax=Pectobacterium carotovorum TaxID=554 RepID=UPI0013740AF8|nr:NACHT domain-containing protein [Pectobacterium carotovorum]QHP53805.1 NACHT domain-containing protein [Pectobacterium carotovorum subsp. carotovorum]
MEKSQVISLFRRYGFEYKSKQSGEDILIFTYKSGFFHNAEIVYFDESSLDEVNKKEAGLIELGYSAKKSLCHNLSDIEEKLFEGFFAVEDWKDKIKEEYLSYSKKVLALLPKGAKEYRYVNVPFKKDETQIETDILEDIGKEISINGSKLILIEAPAGFGKTCTSYEIINRMVRNGSSGPMPFFTEFSRDRQARLFSHVFVSEVEKSFSSVKSNVVIDEVKNGRVLLVLDGFDELLNDDKNNVNADEQNFEKAQPMLETIGDLLKKNAKVVLTSRRSAMFDGRSFQEWVEKYSSVFAVVRYRLNSPEVEDWLEKTRIDLLADSGLDIRKISNPVLLSYLRALPIDDFKNLCKRSDDIVEHYFLSMLDREKERQNLLMTEEQQNEVLTIVAADMAAKNYISDSREKIVDIIKYKNHSLLENVRKNYSSRDRPTVDALANKLATHAFFDRSNQAEGAIEFVNEFVFGNYLARDIINNHGGWVAHDERFVEPAVNAYIPRSEEKKSDLWSGLNEMKYFLNATDRFRFELLLNEDVNESSYDNETITSLNIQDSILFSEGSISNSVFNECMFSKIQFHLSNFKDVTFIKCKFYDCWSEVSGNIFDVSFLNCSDNNNFIKEIEEGFEFDDMPQDFNLRIERFILGKILPIGSESIERLHIFTGLLYKTSDFTKKDITKAIKRLKERDILEVANNSSFTAINKAMIPEIKRILGRVDD